MSDDTKTGRTAIEAARAEIDRLDQKIVRLLSERAQQVQRIGRAKQRIGEPVYQPDREDRVYERVVSANDGPLDDSAILRLFERIIDEARRLERLTYKTDEDD